MLKSSALLAAPFAVKVASTLPLVMFVIQTTHQHTATQQPLPI
jgi:hypothetical protein